MANTQAQNDSIINGIADKKVVGVGGVTAVPVPPATIASVPVFVSGTPQQLNVSRDTTLYINITTAASITISMGPESAGTSVALNAAESDALGLISIHVPRGWYVKITGTVADFALQAVTQV